MACRSRGAELTEDAIRVLVADDQRVVREGLATLLSLMDGIEVVGAVKDGQEALEQAERDGPDVVLMDLRMPVMDGVEATRRIREELRETEVLVLTTYADDGSLIPALRAGARGYLTKDATAEEIEHAIHAVVAGRTHLDPAVQERLVDVFVENAAGGPSHELPDDLTPREAEVLKLIASGLSNDEIAETLVVSKATVKTHVNRILRKTGARDRAQAVRYAFHHGLH